VIKARDIASAINKFAKDPYRRKSDIYKVRQVL